MARTSHLVTPGISNPDASPRLRTCRAWRISPVLGVDSGLGFLTGVFPVVVRLATPGGDILAQPLTVDNDGWQTVPTGPGWFIESVSRTAVEARVGYLWTDPPPDNRGVTYLVECVDDVSECGQVNTRADLTPPPLAVEFAAARVNGSQVLPLGYAWPTCVGPSWATRLAILLKGNATAPPPLIVNALTASAALDFTTPAPASIPAAVLIGHDAPAAPPGYVLAGSTPLRPERVMVLQAGAAWALGAGQYVDAIFRWER